MGIRLGSGANCYSFKEIIKLLFSNVTAFFITGDGIANILARSTVNVLSISPKP